MVKPCVIPCRKKDRIKVVPCPISNSWYGMPVPATALVGESVQTQKVRVDLNRRADSSPVEERSVGKYRKHPTPEHKGIWNGNTTTCRFSLAALTLLGAEENGRKSKLNKISLREERHSRKGKGTRNEVCYLYGRTSQIGKGAGLQSLEVSVRVRSLPPHGPVAQLVER